MNRTCLASLTLAGLACFVPSISEAQIYGIPPQAHCVIERPRPVVTTQMHAQQVTTFCDVNETQISHRQVVENVPVTTCKNVTVDEGGYQMVWVPRPVTKTVAQTVMQQQVKTVAVPVQVTRRVPQVSTQMVPVQTVQYVNETIPLQATAMASTCSTCNGGGMIGSSVFAPQIGLSPIVQPAPYTSAMIPTMPAINVPTPRSAYQPQPITETVTARRTTSTAVEPYETVPARSVPTPREEGSSTPRKSMFNGVPSAAAVWQLQNSR